MPTVTETIKPYMKYCERQDIHCSCLACSKFEQCNNKQIEANVCDNCSAIKDLDHNEQSDMGCYKLNEVQ